jgi:hypothetical protein
MCQNISHGVERCASMKAATSSASTPAVSKPQRDA